MGFQLRDRHGASRSVAWLMLAAAPFVFVTGTILVPHRSLAGVLAVTVTCLAVAAAGWTCWSRPHLMPDLFWLAAPFLSTVFITGINLVTDDASTGAQLFFLWPVLYASNFLSRRVNYVNLLTVFAGDACTVFVIQPVDRAVSDSTSMVIAMSMTAVVVVALRTRNERLLLAMENQAREDPLTGLANRRSFDEALVRSVNWAVRNQGSLALITIDVDYFKSINDTWGHAVGDQALQGISAAMKTVARREDDLAARLGGDEFVMLLRVDRPGAVRAAEALRTAVGAITSLPGGAPGVSMGVAVMPDDASSIEQLLAASDAALYEAKTHGRGRVAEAHDNPPPTAGRHVAESSAGRR